MEIEYMEEWRNLSGRDDNFTTRDFLLARETKNPESNSLTFGKVEIHSSILDEIQDLVSRKINEVIENINDGYSSLNEYASSNVNRDEQIIQYLDAEDIPTIERIKSLFNEEEFNRTQFDNEDLPKPFFQAFRIKPADGSNLVAIKKFTLRQILGTSFFANLVMRGGEEYNKIEENIIAIPKDFDCIICDGKVLILNQRNFESIFDYYKEFKEATNEVEVELDSTGINIYNQDELFESIKGNSNMVRKMKEVQENEYYRQLDMEIAKQLIEDFNLNIEVIENESGDESLKIEDKRKLWDLIKLLNDDTLSSEFTDNNYIVSGKKSR